MSVVYIPTRKRPEFAAKAIQGWMDVGIGEIVIVTELNSDVRELEQLVGWGMFWLLKLKKKRMGIAFARDQILQDAAAMGEDSFIMADDDLIPAGDPGKLLAVARRPDVTGVGAYRNIYSLYCRGTEMAEAERAGESAAFRTKGSIGHCVSAFNTEAMMDMGGYDVRLKVYSDSEIAMRSIIEREITWAIHTGFSANGKASKFMRENDKGGIASLGIPRSELAEQARAILQAEYPGYINNRGHMVKWKRLIEDHIEDLKWPLENVRVE